MTCACFQSKKHCRLLAYSLFILLHNTCYCFNFYPFSDFFNKQFCTCNRSCSPQSSRIARYSGPNWDISEICRMKIYLQNYCCGFLHRSYAGSQSCIYFHFTSSYAKWPKPHFQISTQLSSLRSARASLYELNQLMLICEWGR